MGPDAVAILLGARLATRSNDTQYPFRQDSDFLYLTGFDHPNAAAVLRTDGGPELTLFVEPRDRAKEILNGYRPGLEGALDGYGANEAHPIAELPARIPGLIEPAKRLFHALGRDPALDAVAPPIASVVPAKVTTMLLVPGAGATRFQISTRLASSRAS